MGIQEINVSQLQFNPFEKIGKEWFLITSGELNDYNTMTASWGMMGVLWGENVVQIFVRPTRNTFNFTESREKFTLSFFDESYKDMFTFCGTKSGRDYDKAKECNITAIEVDGTTTFAEANLTLVCEKMYSVPFDKEIIENDDNLKKFYKDDHHVCYIAKIVKAYEKA